MRFRAALVTATAAAFTIAGAAGQASAAETVVVSDAVVYAAPSFQADILARISGSVSMSCRTTADAGSQADGAVMVRVRRSDIPGEVGHMSAPLGPEPGEPRC
jgi:hypothetical protein